MNLRNHILALAEADRLDVASFLKWCEQTGLSGLAASDMLAQQIGLDYLAGKLGYEYCDRVMNSVMAVVTSPEFFAVSDGTVPKGTLDVYMAFDASEYMHPTDKPHESPEEKYTRPMLQALLAPLYVAAAR
jgi:hypothetical protein